MTAGPYRGRRGPQQTRRGQHAPPCVTARLDKIFLTSSKMSEWMRRHGEVAGDEWNGGRCALLRCCERLLS